MIIEGNLSFANDRYCIRNKSLPDPIELAKHFSLCINEIGISLADYWYKLEDLIEALQKCINVNMIRVPEIDYIRVGIPLLSNIGKVID